ncbi:unnamed protein product [Amoebophrya sp. A25]|nr:unnamed protein product [Amoebophrya sp. A25]|eukprot:GSA25T00011929001.1
MFATIVQHWNVRRLAQPREGEHATADRLPSGRRSAHSCPSPLVEIFLVVFIRFFGLPAFWARLPRKSNRAAGELARMPSRLPVHGPVPAYRDTGWNLCYFKAA